MKYQARLDDQILEFDVQQDAEGVRVLLQESSLDVDCVQLSSHSFSLIIAGKSYHIAIIEVDEGYEVTVNQQTALVTVKDEMGMLLEKYGFADSKLDNAGDILVPIPGLIAHIFVSPGDRVETGQKLLILEAMKMENEINSPVSGTIGVVHVKEGDSVDKGTLVIEIEMEN